jgi:hypothetical protein
MALCMNSLSIWLNAALTKRPTRKQKNCITHISKRENTKTMKASGKPVTRGIEPLSKINYQFTNPDKTEFLRIDYQLIA